MAKSKNAVKDALAGLKKPKGKAAAATAKKPKGKVAKAAKPKAAKKPAPKAAKSVVVKVKAPKPKAAAPVVPAAPVVTAPKADVFTLVHQCWGFWSGGPVNMSLEDVARFADVSAVVSGYGKGLCIPTAKAAPKLEEFRRYLAGEKEPEPVPVKAAEPVTAPKPWEPAPESIQRLLDGVSPEGNYGTWIVGGNLWEYEAGWPEPRRIDRTQPEDWGEAGKVVQRDPEPSDDEEIPAEEVAKADTGNGPEPGAEFTTPGEVVCAPVEVPTDGAADYGTGEPSEEPAATATTDGDL